MRRSVPYLSWLGWLVTVAVVAVVGGSLRILAEGPGWCSFSSSVARVCRWGRRVVPRHSWLRVLGAVPRHSWPGRGVDFGGWVAVAVLVGWWRCVVGCGLFVARFPVVLVSWSVGRRRGAGLGGGFRWRGLLRLVVACVASSSGTSCGAVWCRSVVPVGVTLRGLVVV